jgi:hypothetical protein
VPRRMNWGMAFVNFSTAVLSIIGEGLWRWEHALPRQAFIHGR